ncbi:hypothetical protein E0Z10_g4263 [Xylaria hypoxylon]|uniref:Uncharacterized protein n=1 Tax=Xylaria hypoxylon TaxID=37992 RepID=A0A4Z0YLG3_9PEZI|nr:hypothetical protein E0Z10_g4263 [Xylaria hypoxylon]
MAEMNAAMNNASALAAMCGAASATASAARDRRMPVEKYRSPRSNFNAASYMNYLRAPVPPRVPSSRGVGIHIHYQGQCPHHTADGSSSYHGGSLSSDGDSLGLPQNHRISQYPHREGSAISHYGCLRCYWRDFLTGDIKKYKTTCQRLRDTYIWNLRELVRRQQGSPIKPRAEKDSELERLYWYYVGRVREVYDNHCEHHRLLFHDICLMWELPEKVTLPEEDVNPMSRVSTPHSVHSSRGLRTPIPPYRDPTPLLRENGSQRSVAAGRINKGKEKEVIAGEDLDVGTPAESICDDNKGKGIEMETSPIITPSETIAKPQPKNSKISMQQRFRQLWSTKAQEKSSDKALLV